MSKTLSPILVVKRPAVNAVADSISPELWGEE